MTIFLDGGPICAPDMTVDRLCNLIARKDRCFIPAERMREYLVQGNEGTLADLAAFRDS